MCRQIEGGLRMLLCAEDRLQFDQEYGLQSQFFSFEHLTLYDIHLFRFFG